MIDRRAQRDSSISIFRIIAVACAICVLVYFIFALVTGIEPIATVIACALLCIFLCIFIFLTLNPDSVRSQYTEETLSVASAMLEDIKGGLTQESARLVCRRILPETRAMTVAITDEDNVLACAGEFEEKLLPDTPIHTLATRYVIEHGIVQSFNRMVDVVGSDGSHNQVPAGIIAPIKAIVPSVRSSSTTRPRAPSTVPSTRLPRALPRSCPHSSPSTSSRYKRNSRRAPRCVRCKRRLTRTSCSTR
jgi:two-component system sensor histidine kinase LytS